MGSIPYSKFDVGRSMFDVHSCFALQAARALKSDLVFEALTSGESHISGHAEALRLLIPFLTDGLRFGGGMQARIRLENL